MYYINEIFLKFIQMLKFNLILNRYRKRRLEPIKNDETKFLMSSFKTNLYDWQPDYQHSTSILKRIHCTFPNCAVMTLHKIEPAPE